ncbi:MAG: hypothetical protein U1F77_12215 [Kiritimatiellia bacterium]
MNAAPSRRQFLLSSAAAGIGLGALGLPCARAVSPNGKLRVLSIGVIGTIGATDRHQVAGHPDVEIAGLCDVDANSPPRSPRTSRRLHLPRLPRGSRSTPTNSTR